MSCLPTTVATTVTRLIGPESSGVALGGALTALSVSLPPYHRRAL